MKVYLCSLNTIRFVWMYILILVNLLWLKIRNVWDLNNSRAGRAIFFILHMDKLNWCPVSQMVHWAWILSAEPEIVSECHWISLSPKLNQPTNQITTTTTKQGMWCFHLYLFSEFLCIRWEFYNSKNCNSI